MTKNVLTATLVAGMALTAVAGIGTAYAGAHDGKGDGPGDHFRGKMLETLDTNKDGAVSKAEFEARRSADFTAADTNRDASLSLAELSVFHEKKAAERRAEREKRMYERLDANNDGKVTRDEFDAGERFDRMDRNNDGKISADEMTWRGRGGHGPHGGPHDDDPDAPPVD